MHTPSTVIADEHTPCHTHLHRTANSDSDDPEEVLRHLDTQRVPLKDRVQTWLNTNPSSHLPDVPRNEECTTTSPDHHHHQQNSGNQIPIPANSSITAAVETTEKHSSPLNAMLLQNLRAVYLIAKEKLGAPTTTSNEQPAIPPHSNKRTAGQPSDKSIHQVTLTPLASVSHV